MFKHVHLAYLASTVPKSATVPMAQVATEPVGNASAFLDGLAQGVTRLVQKANLVQTVPRTVNARMEQLATTSVGIANACQGGGAKSAVEVWVEGKWP